MNENIKYTEMHKRFFGYYKQVRCMNVRIMDCEKEEMEKYGGDLLRIWYGDIRGVE